jgi:hypothetical protein
MAKLHIISVGGTGHKVLVAAIHLAACGAFRSRNTDQVNEINVISIDADNGNGSLALATRTFLDYKKLYQALHRDDSNLINIDSVVPSLNISLFQDDKKSLSKTFNFVQYNATPEDELIRFLYTDSEIEAEFEKGFYGHTSVGAVIVRDILRESKAWTDFTKQINENDQVVVVGSIFGGTGASCIPVLLEELKEKKKDGAGLATIILTPYFQALGEPDKDAVLQPDSDNFDIKAKAALNYYEIGKKLDATDALYVIGEPNANYSYEIASLGGESQRNKAHPIELFAATAILDFVRNNTDRRKGKVYVAKRAFTNGNYCYTWDMLQDVDKDLHLLVKTFARAAIFYNKVLYPQLIHKNSAGIWEDFYDDGEWSLQTKKDGNNNFYHENIHKYFCLFVEWLFEIHKKNQKVLDPETEGLKSEQDTRVWLFNAEYLDLFSAREYSSGKVKNFEKLVYGEEGRTAERILAELNYNPPKNGKGFPALFTTLKYLLEEEEPKHLSQPSEITLTAYLSQENKMNVGVNLKADSLWIECPTATVLGDIADGLPNKVSQSFTTNDVSIPSPWSIFIMNEMSLTRNKFKALNDNAYNQWCGIIALLVLRRLNRYEQGHELKVQTLKLNPGDRFLKTIVDLSTPKSHIFGAIEPDWLNCAAVKLGKHTIAFLAHDTLVCPAFSINREALTQLHQFAPTIVGNNYEFLNPREYFADQNDSNNLKSKYALSLVLTRLRTEISSQAAKGNTDEILSFMSQLIDRYIEDLGRITQDDGPSPFENDISINNVFDVFDQLCVKEGDDKDLPFILKNTLPGKQVALLSLQVKGISGSELATSYITPSLVYSEIRSDNISNYAKDGKDGIDLVWDQELLCDSMVMRAKEQNSDNAFYSLPGVSIPEYEVVWPVSEKLLTLYTPDQLNKMLSVKREKDTISVTLTLDVMGKMRTHSITKVYRIKNIWDDDRRIDDVGICSIFETRRLPFWAVWPYAKVVNNQNTSVWQRYTFFCVDHIYNNAPVFTIEPFFAGGGSGNLKKTNLSTINESAKEFFYRNCKELPTALQIFEQTGGNPQYRGAVFLNPPPEKRLQTSSWNVGVDFGTTSTTVYYTASIHEEPNFLQLLTEYRWKEGVTDEPDVVGEKLETGIEILCKSEDQDFLDKYFIDKHCLSQKGYTTTFEELDNTNADAASTLFDTGRIFWHNYKNFKDANAVQGRREHLKSGIKWENDKKWAARYLNQMLAQISYRAMERGVSEIHWFFSYPTAFSSDDKTTFNERLNSLIDELNEKTGLKHKFDGEGNLLTESVAAAFFFKNNNPMFGTFLCLDIGGGTSDISIWDQKVLKFQTSAKFASRDMFITPLQKLLERQSVLDRVCNSSDVTDGIHTMLRYGHKDVGKDSIPFLIETVLFEYFVNFKNRLNDLHAEDKQAYHHFVYLVYVAYAGLIFYLTNIIVELLNNPETNGINREIHDIVLGLSGKGSKLTDWIKNYCPPIYKIAESLIKEKTGCEITFKPQFQPDAAKTETAYGLICDLNENGKQNTSSDKIKPKIFMGSSVLVKNDQETKPFGKNDFVPSYDPFLKKPEKLKIQFDDQSLSDFDQFIEFLARVAEEADNEVEAVPLDWYNDRQKKALLSKMSEFFNNQILDKERRFDPPFIVMLKVFLKEYSEYLYEKK